MSKHAIALFFAPIIISTALSGQVQIPPSGGLFTGSISQPYNYSLYVAPGKHYLITSNNIKTTIRPVLTDVAWDNNAEYVIWTDQLSAIMSGILAFEGEIWVDKKGIKHNGTVPFTFNSDSGVTQTLVINSVYKWVINTSSSSAFVSGFDGRYNTGYDVIGGPDGSTAEINISPAQNTGGTSSGSYRFTVIPVN